LSPASTARLRWFAARGRLAAQALVLALVVAATGAFALMHKTVTLDVDGSASTVSAFGRTVGDVLASNGVKVATGDLVAPSVDQLIADEGDIVVRHGREVVVEVDGEERTVWTTGLTVGDVIAEMDLRDGFRASASRSAELGRDVLRFSTAKTVQVVVDGTTTPVQTNALTVREVLQEQGVVLGERDQVSVSLDVAAVDGLVVMVTRVTSVTRSEVTAQPFETVREDDPDLAKGTEVVSVRGHEGSSAVTFVAYEVDGVEIGRTVLARSVLRTPVTEVVRVGTFVAPVVKAGTSLANTPAVEPGTSRAIALGQVLARGWGEDQFACLDKLWSKESGWRVNAYNASSGAYGIPQALPGSKMASAGDDWQTNPTTQITWGLGYIAGRYTTPCGAWNHSVSSGWY
jgi:uncharacterized protein YabE (DUF348 family)